PWATNHSPTATQSSTGSVLVAAPAGQGITAFCPTLRLPPAPVTDTPVPDWSLTVFAARTSLTPMPAFPVPVTLANCAVLPSSINTASPAPFVAGVFEMSPCRIDAFDPFHTTIAAPNDPKKAFPDRAGVTVSK